MCSCPIYWAEITNHNFQITNSKSSKLWVGIWDLELGILSLELGVSHCDRLPDYSDYRDEGCDLFSSCLKCPLPRCRHDKQPHGRRAARCLRDMEILRQHNSAGRSAAEIAKVFGVSKRTIQRIIRRPTHD